MRLSSKGLAGSRGAWRARLPELAVALSLSSVVLPAGQVSAQPASDAPRVAASAEVSILGIDVVVTDRDGQTVHGLKADDFEVRYDGRPVQVTNFHEERGAETLLGPDAPARGAMAPERRGQGLAPGRPPRRIVVFIDQLFLPEPDLRQEVFGELKSFLAKSLGPGDEAMVVSWGGSVQVVRSFTGDRRELERTVDAVARRAARIDMQPGELDDLAARDFWFDSVAEAAGRGPTARAGSDLTRQLFALQAYSEMKAKTAALRGIIALMAGMDGRKALVLVSHRLSRYPYASTSSGRASGRLPSARAAHGMGACFSNGSSSRRTRAG